MVPVSALRPGDRLLGDVLGVRHRVLCRKGMQLTPELIASFRTQRVRLVHIEARAPREDDLPAKDIVAAREAVAHRFALVGGDAMLEQLSHVCLSVLLGYAQSKMLDAEDGDE